jgi:beta-carotene 3-hydroxylase
VSSALIWAPVALVVAAAMEPWAMLLHGRVWHHRLWFIHRSHHRARRGRFEHNDALSALHAPMAIALILYGCAATPGALREVVFGAGVGMTLFGLAYVIVHDGLVHGRLPVGRLAKIPYFARVRDAHRIHHDRGGRAPFGLFLGPYELTLSAKRGAGARSHGKAPCRSRAPTARPRSGR